MERYRLLDHTADIGIIAFGRDLPEVFSNAAYAMFDIITDASKVGKSEKFELEVSAVNIEELLVTWLDELLYRYETTKILCGQFIIDELSDKSLHAVILGEPLDLTRHRIKIEIKNVTYHQLKVEKSNGWMAQVIFDI